MSEGQMSISSEGSVERMLERVDRETFITEANCLRFKQPPFASANSFAFCFLSSIILFASAAIFVPFVFDILL